MVLTDFFTPKTVTRRVRLSSCREVLRGVPSVTPRVVGRGKWDRGLRDRKVLSP